MHLNSPNLLTMVKLLRDKLRRGGGKSQETNDAQHKCYILELPTELLYLITSNLPVAAEAAFALTCKQLLTISTRALFNDTLRFNKDFAPRFHHYRTKQSFQTDRWQLILHLENKKWSACSKCLILHPREAFSTKELRRLPETRVCHFGDLAGIVDICPCKKLTFQGKLRLVEELKTRIMLAEIPSSISGSRVRERYLWHSCAVSYGSTDIQINIFPELEESGNLSIRTEYRMFVERDGLANDQNITPRFGCAHRSLDLWLSSVCQTLYCHRYETICSACKKILGCNKCDSTLSCPSKRPHQSYENKKAAYYFWTKRCLGGSTTLPDKVWAAQRIHPAGSSDKWETCRELCPWTLRMHPPTNHAPSLGVEILGPALEDQGLASQLDSSLHII